MRSTKMFWVSKLDPKPLLPLGMGGWCCGVDPPLPGSKTEKKPVACVAWDQPWSITPRRRHHPCPSDGTDVAAVRPLLHGRRPARRRPGPVRRRPPLGGEGVMVQDQFSHAGGDCMGGGQ